MNMKTLMTRVLILALLLPASGALAQQPAPRCPFVFFDLGQTLVDTSTNNFNPMFYFKVAPGFQDRNRFPTAKEYVDILSKTFGLPLGLLVDVPQSWGTAADPALQPIRDPMTAKFVRTQEFLLGQHPADQSSFTGLPFDWSPFATLTGVGVSQVVTGRVLEPRNDTERKHVRSTALFQRARMLAGRCPAIYMGEIEDEMTLAQSVGMIPFWAGHTSNTFYLPPERILQYLQFARMPRTPQQGPFWRGPF